MGKIVGGALEASSLTASSKADREEVEMAKLTSWLQPVSPSIKKEAQPITEGSGRSEAGSNEKTGDMLLTRRPFDKN